MNRREAFNVLNTVMWNFIENEIDAQIYKLEETISMETLFDTKQEKKLLEELKSYDKQVLRNVKDEMRLLITAKNVSWINEKEELIIPVRVDKEEYKFIKDMCTENSESFDFWIHKKIKEEAKEQNWKEFFEEIY